MALPPLLRAAAAATVARRVRRGTSSIVLNPSGLSSSLASSSPWWRSWRAQHSEAGKPLFSKLLIANRGEIACRVARTAARLGIPTASVFTDPDAGTLHTRVTDQAVGLGPAGSAGVLDGYLSVPHILAAARACGADAVHPGYGFLSESRELAAALEDTRGDITFVGPPASAIAAMGDKLQSKRIAMEAGVNTIPGYVGVVKDEDDAARIASEVGYPVMLKASAGGGGKGMRVAYNEEEAREGFRLSSQEARGAFGDDRILIERFIEEPRHIEIQLMVDAHGNAVYFPQRECSIQRRNQKVIEEAPSVDLPRERVAEMGEQAVALARAVGYRSAGTVEFLVDKHKNFYFLEMNTRLQVEHPVTEFVTGLDLVEMMLRVAAGLPLGIDQKRASQVHGWAMECRLYAEDPYKTFLPSIGRLRSYLEPKRGAITLPANENNNTDVHDSESNIEATIRVDSGVVTHAATRAGAIAAMERALDAYVVRGVRHNAPFLRSVLAHPAFRAGKVTTKFIPEHYPKGFTGATLSPQQRDDLIAIAAYLHVRRELTAHSHNLANNSLTNPSSHRTSLATSLSRLVATITDSEDKQDSQLDIAIVADDAGDHAVVVNGRQVSAASLSQRVGEASPLLAEVLIDGSHAICQVASILPRGFSLVFCGAEKTVLVQTPMQAELSKYMKPLVRADESKVVRSPMPGRLVSISVAPGDKVEVGEELAVVEAMKMRNVLRAEREGTIASVAVKEDAVLSADDVIVTFT
eukprot:jgi/Chlat1/2409/Chrsp17S02825